METLKFLSFVNEDALLDLSRNDLQSNGNYVKNVFTDRLRPTGSFETHANDLHAKLEYLVPFSLERVGQMIVILEE